MSAAYPSLRRLRKAWRRERTVAHARGVLFLLAAGFAFVLAAFALDRLLILPGVGRVVLLAGGAAVLGAVALRAWWRRLRPWDPVRVALQVETIHPELRSILVSHVELLGNGGGSGSVRLIEALHARAEAETAPLDFARVVDPRAVRPAAVCAMLSGTALAAAAVLSGAAFLVFLERMVSPSSQVVYPTRTRIDATSGDLVVQEGSRVPLAARVSGEIPAEGTLDVRFPGVAWEALPARPGGDPEEFLAAVERAQRGFEYRFRIGDARSRISRVEVVPPPRVAASRVRLVFPAYTGIAPRETEALSFETIEGSSIAWELRCDREVAGGEIVCDPGSPVVLAIDPEDRRVARGRTEASVSFGYRLRWSHGPGFVHEGGIAHSVRVLPDAPPRIELIRPEAEEKGTVRKEVEIAFRARDDFGLDEARLVYAINDGPESVHPLGSLADLAPGEPFDARWRPAASAPGLKEGDIVRYRIEVTDTRAAPAPNVGRSAPLRLLIVGTEEYLRYVAERRSRIFSSLQGILREEDESSKNVKSIQDIVQ